MITRTLAVSLLALAAPSVAQEPASRPSIVLVMADDLGWSDIGCYGSEIETPVLDALAGGGLRFTQFYNTARCCPTRASLLTGQYPHMAGVGHMMSDKGHDGYRGVLSERCVTIAEVLGDAGYVTGMFGKWHVTRHVDRPANVQRPESWPCQRGFDTFWGTIHGAGNFFDPASLTDDNEPELPVGDGFYYTDAIGERSARFVQAQRPDQPLFLYVAFTAPHWPLHAPEADIKRQQGRYNRGWDELRASRHRKQIELGIVDQHWPLTDRDPRAPNWTAAEDPKWQTRRMEVYAAQIVAMDRAIGNIVAALQESERLDNTLFLFLADNGGCAEELGKNAHGRSFHAATHDGRAVQVGNDPNVMPGPEDTYQSYGLPWANASNTPFRLYKHYVHEGGISSPLIVHWPSGIEAIGELRRQPTHVIDIMATCVHVAGARYPERRRGLPVPPAAGTSLLPTFRDAALPKRDLFWEHEGNRAMRRDRLKLVARGAAGPWELYDLDNDRTETRDLAADRPEVVAELAAAWQQWAEQHQVLPLLGSGYVVPSKQRRFELEHGADLSRREAPNVAGSGFTFRVSARLDGDGVLFAQGGSSHGYALYRQNGTLHFATRVRGNLTVVVANERSKDGELTLSGELQRDGTVVIHTGPVELLRGKVALQAQLPVDGLQVGSDEQGAVGNYQPPFALRGEVHELLLELPR